MNEKLKNNETQQLFEAFLKLRTVDECANLFDDLCTANEIRSLAQRLAVAKLLYVLCRHCKTDGGEHRDHIPRQPLPAVRERRLQYGAGPDRGIKNGWICDVGAVLRQLF